MHMTSDAKALEEDEEAGAKKYRGHEPLLMAFIYAHDEEDDLPHVRVPPFLPQFVLRLRR